MGETHGRTAIGVLISVAALISGCGGAGGATSEEPPPGPSVDASGGTSASAGGPSPSASATPGPGTGRDVCQAATMKGRIKIQGVGMGSTYAVLIVTNTGDGPCDATGYVGMRLRDEQDRVLPTDVRREGRQLRNLVILPPGESAYSEIRWSTVPATGDTESGPCQRPAETVEVTAPDDTRQFRVKWNGSSVCSQGRITTGALRTGTPPPKRTG